MLHHISTFQIPRSVTINALHSLIFKVFPTHKQVPSRFRFENTHLFQVPSQLSISAYDLTTNNWAHPNFLFKALLNELCFHYNLSRHPFHRVPQKPKAIKGLAFYSTFWKSLRIWINYASHNISNIPTYCLIRGLRFHSALVASRNWYKNSRAWRCSKLPHSSNTECGEKSKGFFFSEHL